MCCGFTLPETKYQGAARNWRWGIRNSSGQDAKGCGLDVGCACLDRIFKCFWPLIDFFKIDGVFLNVNYFKNIYIAKIWYLYIVILYYSFTKICLYWTFNCKWSFDDLTILSIHFHLEKKIKNMIFIYITILLFP